MPSDRRRKSTSIFIMFSAAAGSIGRCVMPLSGIIA